jgi:hypothetical protein
MQPVPRPTDKNTLDQVIELAESFRCCPECGATDTASHDCHHCNIRIVELDDAYWFAEYLKKLRGVMK